MSFRDKYTDEEWKGILPFTGFHHNKVKEELINKASDALRNCDNLVYQGVKKSKQNIASDPKAFLFDELAHFNNSCYDIADAFDLVKEKFKNENIIKMNTEEKKIITQKIFDKVNIEKREGKTPKVILMSVNDYDIFFDPNNQEYTSYELKEAIKSKKTFIRFSGINMIVHQCITTEDGEIEIY